MKKIIINNKPELKPFRKKLRNNSTSAEATLWTYLNKSQLENRKFRRQHSLGNFIADFYCPSENLVIELDGEGHFQEPGIEKDRIKEDYLKSIGIRVIRFENKWVFEDVNWVLERIKAEFNHP
jgi:very-short-patch-repair endonuclease